MSKPDFQAEAKKMNLVQVPVAQLLVPQYQMREVDPKGERFLGLKASIEQNGLLSPVTVMPINEKDPEFAKGFRFALCIGFHRTEALKQLGFQFIPALVDKPLSVGDMLFKQMVENYNRIEPTPSDCAKQLLRILREPQFIGMTRPQILAKIGMTRSPSWVNNYLRLNSLNENLKPAVDAGLISLTNARELASLPSNEQEAWKDAAAEMPIGDFRTKVAERMKQIKAAHKGEPIIVDPLAGTESKTVKQIKAFLTQIIDRQVPAELGNVSLFEFSDDLSNGLEENQLTEIEEIIWKAVEEAVRWTIGLDRVTRENKATAQAMTKEQKEKAKKDKEAAQEIIKNLAGNPEKLKELLEMAKSIK
jgi:ParB/RepB/Spo0J family partition protein